jgi:3-hydroxyisobutyrate dehydrogenase-like beta-hydroxyacid dehydrogenase
MLKKSEVGMANHSVGLLHPGAMGSAVGAAAVTAGSSVLWVSEGRSDSSRERAERAGLDDAGTLKAVVDRCGLIVCVCPPIAAVEVAELVASLGFEGTYLDANAISPARSNQIERVIQGSGGTYIDGSIIGGPPWKAGTTWMYVSGPQAATAVECFDGSPLAVIDMANKIGAASAIKMAYAAYTKGRQALVSAILAYASSEGILDDLMDQWRLSQQDLAASAEDRARSVTAKAWRFAGEMNEISQSFENAGLPGGFHGAAAQIFESMAKFKDRAEPPELSEILTSILGAPSERL